MVKYSKDEIENARKNLKELLKPGDTVYTILRHVSRSGMSRSISMFVVKKNEHIDVTYWASRVLEDRIDQRNNGIVTTGCGMDMGFHLVYNLSWTLFPKGFKAKKNHSYQHRQDGYVKDGGYALNHQWA